MARKIPTRHTGATSPRKAKTKTETTVSGGDRPDHVDMPKVSDLGINNETDGEKAEQTRYNPENADRVIKAIQEVFTIKGAATALDIPRKTIYYWMNHHPDFKERVELAQRTYRRSADAANIALMQKNLKEICEHGWIVKRTTKKNVLDKFGNVVELITQEITQAPPPDWAFQRVLGGNDETQAIKTLATAGWIPDQIAMEIMERIDIANEEVKEIFRKRFNLEDL